MMTSTVSKKNSPKYSPLLYLRQLYDWVMKWAETPRANMALYLLSFTESIFFPIPVDPFLMAVGSAKPRRALILGVNATIFSVLGGCVGYVIGLLFWSASHEFFFTYVISAEKFQIVIDKFNANAFLAIFLAGLTPIPYKVFTLAAGVANIAFLPFVIGSIFGRSLRFVTIGVLLYFYGPQIKGFIDHYFEKICIALGLVVLVGVIVYKVMT